MAERLFVRLDGDPLYAPETSVPTGTLREFQVPTQLRPWVAHVIAYEEDFRAGEEVHERVLPDGSMHLIFELGEGRARSRVTGARLAPAHRFSPREWRRLSRLHDCLRMLRRGEPVCWVSLAADCGYSDQSHLIRDFRDLCGFTPGQFLRRISGSSKTSA